MHLVVSVYFGFVGGGIALSVDTADCSCCDNDNSDGDCPVDGCVVVSLLIMDGDDGLGVWC